MAKLKKYTYQGPLNKLLFFQEAFYKIHIPFTPLFNQDNTTKKTLIRHKSGNIYLRLSPLLFQFSVGWSSDMQFGVIYLLNNDYYTTPCWNLDTLKFIPVALFFAKYAQHLFLFPFKCQYLFCPVSRMLSCLMDGACGWFVCTQCK